MTHPEERPTPTLRRAHVLVGPTAAGKSAVAHRLALEQGLDILSADSMLVYRGMDIGTDKPSAEQQREVRYWGINLADPSEPFSVGDYLQRTAGAVASAGERPLIVAGGTGLYIKCLLEGLADLPSASLAWRALAGEILKYGGVERLQEALRVMSPAHYAALADPLNPRRLIRAYELAGQGLPVPDSWEGRESPVIAGLRLPPEALHQRIERRVERMYEQGLLDEVRALKERFPQLSPTALQAIGYAEALAVLEGSLPVARAMDITRTRTRQLAKRQMTWFRRQARVHWIDVREGMTEEELAAEVRAAWQQLGPAVLASADAATPRGETPEEAEE